MFDTLKYTIITVALFGLSALAVILEKDVPPPPSMVCLIFPLVHQINNNSVKTSKSTESHVLAPGVRHMDVFLQIWCFIM